MGCVSMNACLPRNFGGVVSGLEWDLLEESLLPPTNQLYER